MNRDAMGAQRMIEDREEQVGILESAGGAPPPPPPGDHGTFYEH